MNKNVKKTPINVENWLKGCSSDPYQDLERFLKKKYGFISTNLTSKEKGLLYFSNNKHWLKELVGYIEQYTKEKGNTPFENLDYNISPEDLYEGLTKEFSTSISNKGLLVDDILGVISSERNIKMFKERIHYHLSYEEIGSRYALGGPRVRDIVKKIEYTLRKVEIYGNLVGYAKSESYDDALYLYEALKDYDLFDLLRTNWSEVITFRIASRFKRDTGLNTFGELVSYFAENGGLYWAYYLEGDKSVDVPKIQYLSDKALKSLTEVMFDLFISVEVMNKLLLVKGDN